MTLHILLDRILICRLCLIEPSILWRHFIWYQICFIGIILHGTALPSYNYFCFIEVNLKNMCKIKLHKPQQNKIKAQATYIFWGFTVFWLILPAISITGLIAGVILEYDAPQYQLTHELIKAMSHYCTMLLLQWQIIDHDCGHAMSQWNYHVQHHIDDATRLVCCHKTWPHINVGFEHGHHCACRWSSSNCFVY